MKKAAKFNPFTFRKTTEKIGSPVKPNKFRNKKTEVDGILFDSKKEAKRYGELKLLERACKITKLVVQRRFPLKVNGYVICTYIADFEYFDIDQGRLVVEDTKSPITRVQPEYRIKVKLMKAIYDIDVRET